LFSASLETWRDFRLSTRFDEKSSSRASVFRFGLFSGLTIEGGCPPHRGVGLDVVGRGLVNGLVDDWLDVAVVFGPHTNPPFLKTTVGETFANDHWNFSEAFFIKQFSR
jgi:hypothetical protein